MEMFDQRIADRLTLQKKTGLYRSPPLIDRREGKTVFLKGKPYLSFASNDYLGLADAPVLKDALKRNIESLEISSSSSRLVTGNFRLIQEAERTLAAHFGYEAALIYPSGFQANVGLLSALFEAGDDVFVDQHIHASSVNGMRLSGANMIGYGHGNLDHLEKRLKKKESSRMAVLTESLFSMDGNLLDAAKLGRLKNRYGFLAIVDEAHSFGALGPEGKGLAGNVADIAVGTFGKAFGLFGAFVLLPRQIKDYLINFSAPLMFTTSLPPFHAGVVMDILEIVSKANREREKLAEISAVMKEKLVKAGYCVWGDAHIMGVEIGDEGQAARISMEMKEKGILVFPARYPTVPLHHAILRIGMTALHDRDDVSYFVRSLEEVFGKTVADKGGMKNINAL
jgi:8-amino-7-oxononanoate synthase